jgi:hypothetical protein
MSSITLQLPESLLARVREAGLLDPAHLQAMFEAELRRHELRKRVDALRNLPGEPMSNEEIEAEIDTVRAERRADNASRR